MIWAICKWMLLAYFLARPRRDPVASAGIASHMAFWRAARDVRKVGVSAEGAAKALRLFALWLRAYQAASEYQGR